MKQEKINIGGICLSENSIEPEIDPTINICWECGIHDPNHNSENCPGRKICIKCGETGHKFYECRMPRKTSEMTEQDMEARYCASCKTRTNHTTLDHRACPIKINIIRERASIEREKRLSINKESSRDIELIRKALNFTSDEDWPLPHTDSRKAQHNKIATIVTLALLDEASTPGIFEKKINEACKNNGLQEIKYKLEPNTAKNFQMTLCGAHLQATENIKTAQKNRGNMNRQEPTEQGKTSKYFKDHTKNKNNKTSNIESREIENQGKENLSERISTKDQIGATARPTVQEQEIENGGIVIEYEIGKQTLDYKLWTQLEKELEKNG